MIGSYKGQIYYFSTNMKRFFIKKPLLLGVAFKVNMFIILLRKLHGVQADER